jgi:nitroreductase/NAD-dependent dihydropyrimidine dehydrogenase PreA subunit
MGNFINTEICLKCKNCFDICPCHIFGINTNNEIYFIPEREHICVKCGQCMAICSSSAVKIESLSYEKDFTEMPENIVDFDKFNNFISTRRSIRNFKNKEISKDVINKILSSIHYAPYGSSPEKMNITVVNNRKIIESSLPLIADFLDNIVKWVDSPFMSFMIKRKKGIETFNTIKNHLYPISKAGNYKLKFGDRITRNAPAIIIIHADKGAEEHTHNALIYATYIMLAAHSLGLGATVIGLVPAAINKVKEVREIYKIPEENEAVISVIIGYPKYKFKRIIKRNLQKIDWIE